MGFPQFPNPGNMRGQRIWKTRLLTPTAGTRSVAKSVQMMITQDTVFIVDETNDTIVTSVGAGTDAAITIARGEYTHLALMDAIVLAINTARGSDLEFSSTTSSESINHLRQSTFTNLFIAFNWTGELAYPNTTAVQQYKCARLFSMLGFDTNAGSGGFGAGVGFLQLPTGVWVKARSSSETTRTARIQLSGLNLRVREFRRRPQ